MTGVNQMSFKQSVMRAMQCLEIDERVVIQLAYDDALVEVRTIRMSKNGFATADFRRYSKIEKGFVVRSVAVSPEAIKAFFFQ